MYFKGDICAGANNKRILYNSDITTPIRVELIDKNQIPVE